MRQDSVLIVGAGHDPYTVDSNLDLCVVRTDIESFEGSTDLVSDAHCLPFCANSFDTIMLIEVLEHLREPQLFFEEAISVLKPGGRLFITVPYMYHEHGDPFDFFRFSEGGLRQLAKSFSSIEVLRQGCRVHCMLDLLTTSSFFGKKLLFPLRILSHPVVLMTGKNFVSNSTAPTGFCVICTK